MSRKALVVVGLVFTLLIGATVALAASTFGPFNGASQDSGTCGGFWGNETYKYSIDSYNSSTGKGVIRFQGSGVTLAGSSPNACGTGSNNGKTVAAGIPYGFQGNMDFKLKPGTVPNASCVPSVGRYVNWFKECSGDPNYSIAPNWFWFLYQVCDGRRWQNASANSGGNKGDIAGGLPEKTGACAPPAGKFWNPGDGRVDPRPGDRLSVYCNPPNVIVYGIADNVPDWQKGFLLGTFNYNNLVKAGLPGITKNVGGNGSISMMTDGNGHFYVAWNGGKYGATGQGDFSKSFACTFPSPQ